jgi:hypothetical protein
MAGNTEERSKPGTGNKVPAPGGDASMGSGTRTILSTMPEVRDASLKVAKSAQRLLSIFTQDLEPLIYGEEPFLEAIKRLVLALLRQGQSVARRSVARHGGQQSLSGTGAAPDQLH